MRHLFYILSALVIISLPQAIAAQEVYTNNVVIVLDGSGSMQGDMSGVNASKMQAAKTAITEVMKTIPQSTHVGLIAFGSSANKWVYPLGPRDDTTFFNSLDRIRASGGTPLGEYMKLGADALLKAREKQYGYGSYRLLVVTDGEASDSELVNSYTPDIISRGISVDVIGVDMKQDHTLATRVNSYRRANDPESLKAAIQEVFAEVERETNSGSDDSAFRELDNIPSEIIISIIKAMSESGNHPIGSLSSSRASFESSSYTPQSAPAPQNNTKGFGWIAYLIFIAVIAWLGYKIMKN